MKYGVHLLLPSRRIYVSLNFIRDTWSRSGAAADAGRHNPILYGTIIYTKRIVTYLLTAYLDN